MSESRIWLYLTKRDKSGVRFITQFLGKKISSTRLKNIDDLRLSVQEKETLSKTLYESRLLWEPWLESVDDFEEFRNKLKNRGYKNVPISQTFEENLSLNVSKINVSYVSPIKTMIRKSSS